MDLTKLKYIHFTGIKGVAMVNLAICIKSLGIKITGSDIKEVFVTDEVLKFNKINWKVGFGEQNLKIKPELLITTAAHGGYLNPEVRIAKEKNIPVLSYAEFMSELANTKKVISVCGVGGKTTTSSMIATLLESADLKPSYVIGVAKIFPLGNAGKYRKKGEYFICEADDYVVSPGVNNIPKFMLLNPYITVVTNIEFDHPDVYKSIEDTLKAFSKFFKKIPKDGVLVACIDNSNVENIIKDLKVKIITYGTNRNSDFWIKNLRYIKQKTYFDLYNCKDKTKYSDLVINIPGEFNVRNATAAFIVGRFLGISEEILRKGLGNYMGCRRRLERMGQYKKAIFYDDYAHHPSEITATLKAIRDWYPKNRMVAVFQPHTFSRTKALYGEFTKAFKEADIVGFIDIYPSARESFDATISSEMLATDTQKVHKNVYYLGNHESTIGWINENIKKGDVVLTMGAGDIFHLYNYLKRSKNRNNLK